eukprot:5418472-Pyramimonas_sp.AAC.2
MRKHVHPAICDIVVYLIQQVVISPVGAEGHLFQFVEDYLGRLAAKEERLLVRALDPNLLLPGSVQSWTHNLGQFADGLSRAGGAYP